MKLKLFFLLFAFAFLLNKGFAQNVGIGTTTPQAKLHVNGSFKLQNGLTVNTISSDSLFDPGADSILPTQKAIRSFVKKGSWVPEGNGDPVLIFKDSSAVNTGGILRLMVNGNYAYAITLGNRLCIYDVTDPTNIIPRGSTSTNIANPKGIYVQGNYAYVTDDAPTGVLCVFDVSNPDNIIAKGTITTNLNRPYGVFVLGNYAYVTSAGNHRLCIFDISNPNAIVAKGFTSTNLLFPWHLYVRGSYAYVVNSGNRFSIFDISNPDNIITKGTIAAPNPAWIQVRGNYAYVACVFGGLQIFDISNPDAIVLRGSSTANTSEANIVELKDNYAYVSCHGNGRICVFDISDPDYITPKGFTETNVSLPEGLAIKDKYVLLSSWGINRLCSYYISQSGGVMSVNSSGNAVMSPSTWESGISNAIYRMSGNVGIGTISPSAKLEVTGNTIINGYMGIGTTNPSVPLEVVGSNAYNVGTYQYINQSGSGFFNSSNVPVSIRASSVIVALEIEANSDVRIKRNINTSSSLNDLSTLLKVRVADYQLKDSVFHGNRKIKGFIAQELEKVMPQAVHTNTDFIPDIYCLSTTNEYNEKDKTLKISLCKPHDLKVGDKVKVFAGDGMQEQYVSAINDETTFTVNNWEIKQAGMNPISKVFVWGKQVTDFHTVDYNQVFSLGISAMQQLAKENDELKVESDKLKMESETQKKINQSLQQQIDELKKILLKK